MKAAISALWLVSQNAAAFQCPLRLPHTQLNEGISKKRNNDSAVQHNHNILHQSSNFDRSVPRIGLSHKRSITSLPSTKNDSLNIKNSRLLYGYRLTSILYIITSLAIFLTPNRMTSTTTIPYTPTKVAGACGYAIAGAVSHILCNATGRNRLESDTYKRLNIGLFLFAALGMLVVPGEASFYPNFRGSILIFLLMGVSKACGGFCAFQGWTAGVVDGGLGSELWNGFKETWTGFKPETKETNIYRILFVTVFYILLGNNAMNLYHSFQKSQSIPLFNKSLFVSAIARLSLFSTIIYTLKDGAERKLLRGKTFVQLNLLMSGWAISAQGFGYGSRFSIRKSLSMLMFGYPFLVKAFNSVKEREL